MQTSGAMRREIANAHPVVIPRCAIAHLRARSANFDVQLHIRESINPQSWWWNGFRARAKRRALRCAIAHRGMTNGGSQSRAMISRSP